VHEKSFRVSGFLFTIFYLDWFWNRNAWFGVARMVDSQAGNQIFKPVSCITGGVGPMTVSMLMENTVLAAVRFFRIFYIFFSC
jgi:hypothetical protein